MQRKNSSLYLGLKISETRKSKGLSQEALAEVANISLSTIQRIEKGKVVPRPYTLKILADTLELDMFDLSPSDTDESNLDAKIASLKKISIAALLVIFVPLINILLPLLVWKMNKEFRSKNDSAGKIISFQLLWSILTFIAFMTTIFLHNLISGNAGDGLYFGMIVYVIFIVSNILLTVKTIAQLNKGEMNILSFVPNLF